MEAQTDDLGVSRASRSTGVLSVIQNGAAIITKPFDKAIVTVPPLNIVIEKSLERIIAHISGRIPSFTASVATAVCEKAVETDLAASKLGNPAPFTPLEAFAIGVDLVRRQTEDRELSILDGDGYVNALAVKEAPDAAAFYLAIYRRAIGLQPRWIFDIRDTEQGSTLSQHARILFRADAIE